jgi:hypothetical protein
LKKLRGLPNAARNTNYNIMFLILIIILIILFVGWLVLHPIKTAKALLIVIVYFVAGLLGILGMALLISRCSA